MIRVLHFSDVHVDVPFRDMPAREFLGKRLIGGANLLLRRKRLFRDARAKLAALARFADEQAVDLAICTGDYTALGTGPELAAARAAIEPLTRRPRGFVTVPGNHDLYCRTRSRTGASSAASATCWAPTGPSTRSTGAGPPCASTRRSSR